MHIQIVNFELKNLSFEDYSKRVETTASVFANLPGLRAKIYLADEAAGTFGGVYVWETRDAMEAYKKGAVFAAVQANPNFSNVRSTDFSVLEAPTRITHGLAEFAT